jgi:hypothetical protein
MRPSIYLVFARPSWYFDVPPVDETRLRKLPLGFDREGTIEIGFGAKANLAHFSGDPGPQQKGPAQPGSLKSH